MAEMDIKGHLVQTPPLRHTYYYALFLIRHRQNSTS